MTLNAALVGCRCGGMGLRHAARRTGRIIAVEENWRDPLNRLNKASLDEQAIGRPYFALLPWH